jgi:hypothetical protein
MPVALGTSGATVGTPDLSGLTSVCSRRAGLSRPLHSHRSRQAGARG